jgi:hypothetical protein
MTRTCDARKNRTISPNLAGAPPITHPSNFIIKYILFTIQNMAISIICKQAKNKYTIITHLMTFELAVSV